MPKTKTKPTAPPLAQDVLSRKRRRTATFTVDVDDPTACAAVLRSATSRHRSITELYGADSEQAQETQAALDEAQAALDACQYRVQLQALSVSQFRALLKEHPPTDEQKAARADWSPDTFQPALIAASAIEPELTAEQWAEQLDEGLWSQGEWNALFNTALELNIGAPQRQATSLAYLGL